MRAPENPADPARVSPTGPTPERRPASLRERLAGAIEWLKAAFKCQKGRVEKAEAEIKRQHRLRVQAAVAHKKALDQAAQKERKRVLEAVREVVRGVEVETDLARMLVENKRQWRKHGGRAKEDAHEILAGIAAAISLRTLAFLEREGDSGND